VILATLTIGKRQFHPTVICQAGAGIGFSFPQQSDRLWQYYFLPLTPQTVRIERSPFAFATALMPYPTTII